MINGLDSSAQTFLADINRIQARLERAQRQISSGLRVTRASDAPNAVSNILADRVSLDLTEQVRQNLGRVKNEVDTAEQSVQQAVKIMERVRTLAAQGATGSQTAESRLAIATEVRSLQEQLVGIACTTVEGRYIFSGDEDWTPPFRIDDAAPNGVTGYEGGAATRQALHPSGGSFAISKPADELFDNADNSAFQAINDLRIALESNDEAAILASLESIEGVEDHLNRQLGFYGATQGRVTEATDFASRQELQRKASLSTLRDADTVEAALELTQARTHQEAAFSMRGSLPNRSLFDYLG